ncbi:MAG: polysaccharide deacetylase family protein [Clostridia bacterium]|nr:polysaccharide deacetylase family protein [Clostridia bacterium]
MSKWRGKNKAVTFSFDDGVTQDERLIEILNKYSLKGTFNINSSLLGLPGKLQCNGNSVNHTKIRPDLVKKTYSSHEVAVHTLTHPNLTTLSDETVVYQVEEDRKTLSRLVGYEVTGMAYPCGGVNNDDRVAALIKSHTSVKYSRTITSTDSFEPQTNLYRFNPTVYYVEVDKLFDLGEKFLSLQAKTPALFYIWGHSYEMDADYISWEKFEEFCKMISFKEDIFYGTNREVLL